MPLSGWSLGSLSSKLTDRTGIAARLGADTSTEDQAEVGVNHKISKDVDVGAQLHADRDGKLKGEVNGGVQVDERTRIAAKYDGNAEVGAGRQLNENLGLNARAQRGEDGETQVSMTNLLKGVLRKQPIYILAARIVTIHMRKNLFFMLFHSRRKFSRT